MKKTTFKKARQTQLRGMSIIEILLALVIMSFGIVAATAVAMGAQESIRDAGLSQNALYKIDEGLENAFAALKGDWGALSAASILSDGIYQKGVNITDISECMKLAESRADWNVPQRAQDASLTTLFTSIEAIQALGGDCDTDPLTDWDNPHSIASVNITGQSGATDIDAHGNFLYLTTSVTPASKDDFFVFEFDSSLLSSSDPDDALIPRGSLHASAGLNRVDVASSTSLGGAFAFIANASSTASESSDELLVLNINDPDNPFVVGSATLGITPSCPGAFCPGGASAIYYYDGKVYVGTHRINGNEFYVYDVVTNTPAAPLLLGSLEINHNVNDIAVSGSYAYLATSDDSGELMVIDISNPGALQHPDITGMKFNAGGAQDGTRLFVLGKKVYLGRAGSNSNSDDFLVFDVTAPTAITLLGSKDIGLQNNTYVSGIVVRGTAAFIALDDPTTGFQILNISSPSSITDYSACSSYNFSENTTGLDMEGNFVFTANSSNAEIRVIEDQPTICVP